MGSRAYGLPIGARGLYREMLSQAWLRGARLPNDYAQIRRFTAITIEEWNELWPLVSQFWRQDGPYLVNDTQIEVYTEAKARQDRAQVRAQVAARASAQARLKQSPPSPSPSPSLISGSVSGSKKEKQAPIGASLSPAALPQRKTNGTPTKDPFLDPIVTERAGRFVERYGELYASKRNGARYASKIHRDYAAAVTLCQTWPDDERLDKLAICFLTTDHKFAEEGSRTIPQFLALASWCDGKLAEWEKDKQKRSAS